MKFSIITPVYNWNNYTKNYVNSINSINYFDFELVIVDDGSTDDVIEHIKNNIKCNLNIIHQENSGILAAEINGINNANGEYIVFCDSDDLLSPNIFNYLHKTISEFEDVDLIQFKTKAFYSETEFKDEEYEAIDISEKKYELIESFFRYNHNIVQSPVSLATKCVKKSIFNFKNLSDIGRIKYAPDAVLSCSALLNSKTIIYLPINLYYAQRIYQTTSTNYSSFRFCEWKKIYEYYKITIENLSPNILENIIEEEFINNIFSSLNMVFIGDSKLTLSRFKEYCDEINSYEKIKYLINKNNKNIKFYKKSIFKLIFQNKYKIVFLFYKLLLKPILLLKNKLYKKGY